MTLPFFSLPEGRGDEMEGVEGEDDCLRFSQAAKTKAETR